MAPHMHTQLPLLWASIVYVIFFLEHQVQLLTMLLPWLGSLTGSGFLGDDTPPTISVGPPKYLTLRVDYACEGAA